MNATLIALLSSLCLFESTAALPVPVERVSLFGYRVGPEVLDLDEAAARAELLERPAPAATIAEIAELHRQIEQDLAALKGRPAATFLGMPLEVVDCDTLPAPAPVRVVVLDETPVDVDPVDQAPEPTGEELHARGACLEDEGRMCDACTVALAEPDPDEDLVAPALGRAVLCPACNGGTRHVRAGCPRCDGRFVRVFVENHEYKLTPPDTEAGRLGMAYALADLLPELPERAVKGALELLDVALKGADTSTRRRGLAQWEFMRNRQAVA